MRHFLVLALAALTLACEYKDPAAPATAAPALSVATPTPTPVAPPPVAADTGDAANGKRLFLSVCANCHGPDGTGDMMKRMMPTIGNLTDAATHARLSDEDITNLVMEGRDKMPAFKDVLPPPQIKAIIAYVRTLKRG